MDSQYQPQPNFSGQPPIPLPNSTTVLVMGILGIAGCFCYGLPGVVFSIIALVLSKKDLNLYHATPAAYTPGSLSNVKAGRICATIGLILSALYLMFFVIILIMFGASILSHPQDIFNQLQHS